MPYVVTQPEDLRGIYDTWDECKAAISGRSGVRQMKVTDRAEGEAVLAGGVILEPGMYAFTDGNAGGGVGVVIVRMPDDHGADPEVLREIRTSVDRVLRKSSVTGLESPDEIDHALGSLANILAELAALYAALEALPSSIEATIVYDYAGVGAFMNGEWRSRDRVVRALVAAAKELSERKGLRLKFRHQHGHRSTFAGRHDLARFNARADQLATLGTHSRGDEEDAAAERSISPAAGSAVIKAESIRQLLESGESATLEFKASARWGMRLKARNGALEDAIVKTIVGFANSHEGGVLVIGVADDGTVVGLDRDFRLTQRGDADAFENWLTTLLMTRLGKEAAAAVRIEMTQLDGRDLSILRTPASMDAVFDHHGGEAHFFVRMNNSTREMNAAEMHRYARRRFG
jgi:ribonuclease HI